jgi:hypothetical protein
VVDNAGKAHDRVYFGAPVTVADDSGAERTVSIVGVDELDPGRGRVSWISPIATALLKAQIGDVVTMRTPRGISRAVVGRLRSDRDAALADLEQAERLVEETGARLFLPTVYEERGRLSPPGAERERWLAAARRLYDEMGAPGLAGRFADGVVAR